MRIKCHHAAFMVTLCIYNESDNAKRSVSLIKDVVLVAGVW